MEYVDTTLAWDTWSLHRDVLKERRRSRRVPAKVRGMHSRDEAGKSVRVAPKIRARENRPSDLTLDYLRGWHYQAIRAAAASRSPMMLSLRHRRFVIGLEVLAWAGATKWLVSPVRQSLLSSSSSPRPHLLVLFFSTVVNRTSSRDGCIKHFATTICDTFVRDVRARTTLRSISPRKVSRRRVVNFSADAIDIT